MTSFLFDKDQIEPRLKEHKIPNFRLKQIFHEIFKNQNIEWDEMTTLSKELRSDLSSFFSPLALEMETTVETNETTKFGFKTEDGHLIESVIMYHWQDEKYQKGENRKLNRITICVSSQVGCPVNCLFCVTGKLGFTRNLTWQEILSQVIYANAYLKKKFGKREDGTLRGVRNVVFMGMGEPLLNYENVKKSCEMLLSQEYFSLGRRHVTISTSGIIPGIENLIKDQMEVKLAVSLHAPNQALREKIMPIARVYPLDKLMKTIDAYVKATDNRIFYEYIMIKNITDTPEIAKELVTLIQGRLAHVNLIPYNENPAIDLKESDSSRIAKFKKILEDGGITVTSRASMGRESKGACGQLGYEKIKKS